MYFTLHLAFVDYLDQLHETISTPIERNWTNNKQILPLSLESFQLNSSLLQAPKTLKDFVNQYQESSKMIQVQEKNTPNSKFKTFLTSFITNVLVFPAALVTVAITFIIIYMLTVQSKFKTLVANIALQHVKAIEALNPQNQGTQL